MTTETQVLTLIDQIAYALWESDREADPMLHSSYALTIADYRRRAVVALEVVTGTTP